MLELAGRAVSGSTQCKDIEGGEHNASDVLFGD